MSSSDFQAFQHWCDHLTYRRPTAMIPRPRICSTNIITTHTCCYISSISPSFTRSSSIPKTAKSPISTLSGLTNTPLLGPHWKYLFPSPPTRPSFLPTGSSNSTPVQGRSARPGSSGIGPTYRMMPRRVSSLPTRHRAPKIISIEHVSVLSSCRPRLASSQSVV